jgi:hypothetical protein
MDNDQGPPEAGEARTAQLLRQEAARRAASPGSGASPTALEATLASISDEVTAEAVERQADAKKKLG